MFIRGKGAMIRVCINFSVLLELSVKCIDLDPAAIHKPWQRHTVINERNARTYMLMKLNERFAPFY